MIDAIASIVRNVRDEMISLYGDDLAGHCIEASDKIATLLSGHLGLDAVTVEGWCKYDDEFYGSDHPWDPHTWVEVPSLGLYIDVTADQFNFGMDSESQFPSVIIQEGLPHGMQYEEPMWEDYEMEYDNEVSGIDYLNDIQAAYEAISHALESVDLAENEAKKIGLKIHPSIGNNLSTVKSILSETLEFANSEHEKMNHAVPENVFWFSLSEDKCISVWAYPDGLKADQLLMKLEERAEDGSMGPHCEVLIDESYASGSLSQKDIRRCLCEIYEDAGLSGIANTASLELTQKVMSVFGLNKRSLEAQIFNASEKTNRTDSSIERSLKSPDRSWSS